MDASPDIDSTLRRLHLFVMTSDFEGLPNSAMEALSMGIPIVSTPVGDVRELVVAGSTGVYLESNDPVEVADTIAEALADKGLLKRALTDGPTLVKEKFSLDRAVDKLAAAYQGLLA
jgi:glycosyltransferase involved in cell wall biosynthesis